MEFTLCYKSYPFKMSLQAMKQFEERTGKDLWSTLLQFLDEWMKHQESSVLTRCAKVSAVISFNDAAEMLHALVKAEDKSIPLDEIRDGMFRVGWMPSDASNDQVDPYTAVLFKVGTEINTLFNDGVKAEKKLHAATELRTEME